MQGMSGELSGKIRALLGDVEARHLRKLEQLRARLQSRIFEWDHGELADALQQLHAGGRELHFAELRPGWIQRVLGRHRAGFQRFAAEADRMDSAAAAAREHAQALAAEFKEHDEAVRRVFMELDLECKELTAALERGVTWLQQMCEEINDKRTHGSTDSGLATLAETAQAYTQDFKHLQSISSKVRDIDVRGHAILDRRAALLEQVRAQMDHFEKQWNAHVGEVAAAVRAGHHRLSGIPKAIEAHGEAMKRLDATLDACGALQGEEQFMTDQLDALGVTLQEKRAPGR